MQLLVSDMEQAKAMRQATSAIFLDIKKAFDAVPHTTIIAQLLKFGVSGRALAFIRAFLSGRTMRVRLNGTLSSLRNVAQGVPQGSVISPFLFNIVMAALPDVLRRISSQSQIINMAIYADDVALWATAPTNAYSIMQRTLQQGLTAVANEISRPGLTLSAFKTAAFQYHPTARSFTSSKGLT